LLHKKKLVFSACVIGAGDETAVPLLSTPPHSACPHHSVDRVNQ
jgi:hypothetical protein